MKIGLTFANSGPFCSPDLLAHFAQTAERCGFESLWTVEHVVLPQNFKSPYPYSRDGKIPGANDEIPISDPLLPLAFAAAVTTKLRLATGVMILPQRHPIYVAKEVATLDVLSKGRIILGIGSGWLEEEFDALGIDFHVRGARTDESIRAMRALWAESPAAFNGKHFKFGPVFSNPKPVQKGGVPIHVGGNTPPAVRRAAKYGDGYIPVGRDLAAAKEAIALLKAECSKIGRNPNEIELSSLGLGTLDYVKQCQDLGLSRVVIPPPAFDRDGVTRGLEKVGNELIAKL
jgi:probable F420-dependent oxidoreductase